MNPSGNPMTRAPLRPASWIRRQAFSVDLSRSRKTEAACTAATFTTPYASPIACHSLRAWSIVPFFFDAGVCDEHGLNLRHGGTPSPQRGEGGGEGEPRY